MSSGIPTAEREFFLRALKDSLKREGKVRRINETVNEFCELNRKAFSLVCDPDDWKKPVCFEARSDDPDLHLYLRAIKFMTATEPVMFITGKDDNGVDIVTVVSEGYRAGPAGP